MPFDTDTNPPDQNFDVRIFFEGLEILRPQQDATSKYCEVRALNHGTDHELSVDVSIDEPTPNQPFLRIGSEVRDNGLEITTTAPKGVKKYQPTTTPNASPYSLLEAIDLNVLHPGVALVNMHLHKPIIIRDGILYTEKHRDRDVSLTRDGVCKPREPLALTIGMNIHLQSGGKLQLKWGSKVVELPIAEDNGPGGVPAKYIIWINNRRPVTPATDPHDFDHYYAALDPSVGSHFQLDFKKCGDKQTLRETPFTSPRILCIPAMDGA
jgi:hypothetical protein